VRKFKKGGYVQTSELTFEGFNETCKSMIRDGAGTGEYSFDLPYSQENNWRSWDYQIARKASPNAVLVFI
jgi:hypothetical protein